MYTIDANVFVDDANPQGRDSGTSHRFLEYVADNDLPIIVPVFVLTEVAGALGRQFRDPIRARIFSDLLRAIPTISFVTINDALATEAANIAADRALRGADAIYMAVARQYKCQLVTLDKEVLVRAAPIVTVRTPAEVLAELAPL